MILIRLKKNFNHLILDLLVLLLISTVNCSYADTIIGPKQEYRVEYSLWVENDSSSPRDVTVKLPLAESFPPHQEVISVDFEPAARVETNDGGKVAVYHLKAVKPGEKISCLIKARVINRRVIYDIDPGKIKSTTPIKTLKYLDSSRRYPAAHYLVRKKAKEIVGDEKNPYYRALKIYEYVRNLDFELQRDPVEVIRVIRSGKCQCSDATNVFIALCRSVNIPARYIGGIYLKETDTSTPDTHSWAEIYLHPYGWIPVDPTMGRFDRLTRLSRFAEIDFPYLILWRDVQANFSISSDGGKKALSNISFGRSAIFKSQSPRKGINVKRIYPDFSYQLEDKTPPDLSPEKAESGKLLKMAEKAFSRGDTDKAEKLVRKLISIEPGFLPAYLFLASIHEKAGNLSRFIKEIENSDVLTGDLRKFVLGRIYFLMGNYSRASRNYSECSGKGVNSFLFNYYVGSFYLYIKQLGPAAMHLNQALLQNPKSRRVYSQLFDLLNYLNYYRGSIALSRAGLRVLRIPEFYDQIARSYLNLGRYSLAEDYAKKAVRSSPGNGSFLSLLGRIHLESGKKEKGLKEIKKALELKLPDEERQFLEEIIQKHLKGH